MKGSSKLILDIVMGAVIPILVLNNFARITGSSETLAYVIAAIIPVTYVLIDTFFISRKFNVITSYVALSSIVSGILVFWFVDGVRFALKDTAALIVATLVFLGSMLIGKPMMQFFASQVFQADTAEKEGKLKALLGLPNVRQSLFISTGIVAAYNVIVAIVNFLLNLNIVTAKFGESVFNQQVAQVNGITRIAFTIASLVAFGLAFTLIYRAVFKVLPKEEGKSQFESDFWELVRQSEQRNQSD
jgi:hypothetical protein